MSECVALLEQIRGCCSQRWTVMEVCGGQTHALLRHGLDRLLEDSIELIHGPGCPVCVTDSERIDQAIALVKKPEVTLCSYGDMLRVPGSDGSNLLGCRSEGADVRVIYSPLDVLEIARRERDRQVVFLAVGFETTAPATGLLVQQAHQQRLTNLRLLMAHVRVAPALDQLLGDPACTVQGLLAAGHVCAVMGEAEYVDLAAQHRRPIVMTGFSPEALLRGILCCIKQLEEGRHDLRNAYEAVVDQGGNSDARRLIETVFEPVDRVWRGLGVIGKGGYRLRDPYSALAVEPEELDGQPYGNGQCPSGQVLRGLMRPGECPSFGDACTPAHPLGAPMVSSEGACAAYFRFHH